MRNIFILLVICLFISNSVKSQTEIDSESIFKAIELIKNKLISSDILSIEVKLTYTGCYGKSTVLSSILISDLNIKLISFTEGINGRMTYDTFSFTKKEFLSELEKHKSLIRTNGYGLVIGGASQKIKINYLGQKEMFYTEKGILLIQLFSSGLKLPKTT